MTDVSRNGPQLWTALLDEIALPGAVVAGGCIRDLFLGLEPKDIDIFVPIETRARLEQLGDKLSAGFFFDVDLINMSDSQREEYEEALDGRLIGVLEGEAMGLPVNIIARSAHADGNLALIESFDFGILQWHYSHKEGTASIIGTDAAMRDLAMRTATLMRADYMQQSLQRFDRFNVRHPNLLKLVNPYQGSLDIED